MEIVVYGSVVVAFGALALLALACTQNTAAYWLIGVLSGTVQARAARREAFQREFNRVQKEFANAEQADS